jgi:signal transduction histidine kinase
MSSGYWSTKDPFRSLAHRLGRVAADFNLESRLAHELYPEKRPGTQKGHFPAAMLVDRGAEENQLQYNEKFTALFGYTSEDVPDIDHWWRLAYPDAKYRAEIRRIWEARVEVAVKNRSQIKPVIARARCKDGSYRDIEFHFSCLGDSNVVSFVDLTWSAKTKVDETASSTAIAQAEGPGSQIAAALAHELAQPLSAILINARAAERFADRSDPDLMEIREALADITKDGRRALAVLENIRAMFMTLRITSHDLDLNQVVDQVNGIVENEALSRGVQLRLMLSPGALPVRGDESILQQVLLNLISNGMDAMKDLPTERRSLTVTTTVRGDRSCAIILVEDNGNGIAETDEPKLFTPFFTTKSGGLGMGLSISRALVESVGGRINLRNQAKPGATFEVELPLVAP